MVYSFQRTSEIRSGHVSMARAALGLSVRDLAKLAGVNKATIVRTEAGLPLRYSTLEKIRLALESKGAEFLSSDETGRIAVSVMHI